MDGNDRSKRVLAALVRQYIATGEPIASAVLVTSSANSYYPNIGTGYLLPAYAAAYLGLSLGGGLRFNVLGSYLGVLLLGMVTTGLTMLNQPSWMAALVQGAVLLVAVAGVAIRRRSVLGR